MGVDFRNNDQLLPDIYHQQDAKAGQSQYWEKPEAGSMEERIMQLCKIVSIELSLALKISLVNNMEEK